MATSLKLMVLATRMKSWRSHLIFSLEESIRQTERYYLISFTSNAQMVGHSVDTRDELHKRGAGWVSVFCFDNVFPRKSLALLLIWSVLLSYGYEFLKLSTSAPLY